MINSLDSEGSSGWVLGMKTFASHSTIVESVIQPESEAVNCQPAKGARSRGNYYYWIVFPLKIIKGGKA